MKLRTGGSSRRVRVYFNRVLDLFDKMVYGETCNYQNRPGIVEKRMKQAYSTVFRGR